ncbi:MULTISPECIES: hypothetical protein [Bradyrhizobium]|jgi:hypothetical protein|uniref:hypothetical protein n=1 Tax=Bradyrhizobium TaxID=374 RepID=UPI0009B86948|nr:MULTISPECIES: hypothetical protein [Bradyrhizobium]MCS3449560.1 hypothetical protein [Bradyrhizobium elkanii]MCS3559297.1 hypothetical protein [Bradyrhizobium elkanii]MCW2150857.1 hypothetical protein [Bradyrhizobium elkanii]MCW2359101.1 hypothetical protein [Bradyrhizobium elkanii]MCW2374588.1 hypothetical protein [Bradyrhizobium elkanii]
MTLTQDWKKSTAAQRAAQKAFKEAGAAAVMSEYSSAQNAFHANRERLKAERLAREGAQIANTSDKGKS